MARDAALERAWRERLARQAASGLTIRAFCEQEGLPPHQFSWWQRQLRIRDGQMTPAKKKPAKRVKRKAKRSNAPTAAKQFLPVEVTPPKMRSTSIEIVLDQPPRVAVTAGFDPQVLAEVLRVLEKAKC